MGIYSRLFKTGKIRCKVCNEEAKEMKFGYKCKGECEGLVPVQEIHED